MTRRRGRRRWKLGVRLAALAMAGAGLAILAGCGDGTGPVDRTLVVRLASAPGDDGALVFKVLAAGRERIDTVVAACSGCRVYARRVSDNEMRVVVTGTLAPGPLVQIGVSNPTPQSFTAFAVEGASRSYVFRPGTLYELTVGR